MGKKTKIAVKALVILFLVLAIRFILGGSEDSWICQNGVWVKHGNPSTPMPTSLCDVKVEIVPSGEINYKNATSDLIVVDLPFPGAVTGKEFSVIGKARGYWFFEASFPIQVLDKDGKILATAIAEAQEEWMTENFVPFKADLKIPESYIGPATLILNKDNPSGLPENEASISFPIIIEY